MERTAENFKRRQGKTSAALALIAFSTLLVVGGCATGPVETDPEKAAARWAEMREYCYKQGGVWNDEVKTCLTAGKSF